MGKSDDDEDLLSGEEEAGKPLSLFSLEDKSFPFVCTYDQLLRLLDNTIQLSSSIYNRCEIIGLTVMYRRVDRKNFLCGENTNSDTIAKGARTVDFNVFKVEYWTCLAGIISSQYPPELLFSEFMGTIKGSNSTAMSLEWLTREQYLSKSSKTSPAFSSEADRERVYTAFERYEKLKKQRNEVDELDRVLGLLRSIRNDPSVGQLTRQGFEEIYVDGSISSSFGFIIC